MILKAVCIQDMPIIDDEEMDFLDEKPTLGKQRKGFQDGEDE